MGGPSSPSFTPTETKLDAALEPRREFALSEAERLYKTGGPAYYSGATYVSPSEATKSALDLTTARATAGSPLLRSAQGTTSDIMGYTSPYAAKFESLGASAYDPSAGFYRDIQAKGTPGESREMIKSTASGAYLGDNPYLSGALSQANRLAAETFQGGMQDIQAKAAAAGRYGSGAMGQLVGKGQDVFARAIAEQNQKAYMENYARERAAQEEAISRLSVYDQQQIINRMAASKELTAGEAAALAARVGATGKAADVEAANLARRLEAAEMAPTLAAADYADLEKLLAAGKVGEGYTAEEIAAKKRKYDYEANLPYAGLEKFGSFITGLPRGGVTTEYVAPNAAATTTKNTGGASGGFADYLRS